MNIKNNKGLIAIYVIVSFIFLTIILISILASSKNAEITALQSQKAIKDIYENDVENADKIYSKRISTATNKSYTKGDVVTVGEEEFYVLEDSGENDEMVTLFAAKNIDTTTLIQSDSANTVAFYSEVYWTSIAGIKYPYNLNNEESSKATAINYAKSYGIKKGGTGRLLTKEEVEKLGGDFSLSSSYERVKNCPSWIKLGSYWLGYVVDGRSAGILFTNENGSGWSTNYGDVVSKFGVRPVITIHKVLIS